MKRDASYVRERCGRILDEVSVGRNQIKDSQQAKSRLTIAVKSAQAGGLMSARLSSASAHLQKRLNNGAEECTFKLIILDASS